jgi:hypothetical protein
MTLAANELIDAIRRALPPGAGDVGLHEPELHGREAEYLRDCIESGWVSYLGAFVDRFERELAALCDRRHAFATDLLSKGVPVSEVAAILGNSPRIVEKHYSQWIQSRQTAIDSAVKGTWI